MKPPVAVSSTSRELKADDVGDREKNTKIARHINAFGAYVLQSLTTSTKMHNNAVATLVSPWGLAHVLAMALEGAEVGSPTWNSLVEIVFGLDPSAEEEAKKLSIEIKLLTDALVKGNDGEVLRVSDANLVWVRPEVQLQESYTSSLQQLFLAGAFSLEDASAVNSWVSENTGGKIKSILDESMARQMDLVLINAIYFKGLWSEPFKLADTQCLPFYRINGTLQDTPLMYMHYTTWSRRDAIHGAKISVPGIETSESMKCMAVRLRYRGEGGFSAIAAAPEGFIVEDAARETLTLDNGTRYEDALEACRKEVLHQLSSATPQMRWLSPGDEDVHSMKIWLPRFQVETSAKLSETLSSMGLRPIFHSGDFSRISRNRHDLFVSDVIQKVYIKVDEEGTEAAAASEMMMFAECERFAEPVILEFKFDRPFVFCIVHEPTNVVLFAGTIFKPEQSVEALA